MNRNTKRRVVKTTGVVFFLFVFLSLSIFVYLVSSNKVSVGYNIDYQPDQPIPFSHKIHAGQYQIDCRYCHTQVERSPVASVPSLDICMNCHLTVKVNSPWIKKIRKAYENKEPIAWQKVHLLPDFVRFNHSLHIQFLTGGGQQRTQQKAHEGAEEGIAESFHLFLPASQEQIRRACTTCHGKVENMELMYQYKSLSMGWCVRCHRQKEHQAPINCSTCHY